MIVDCFEKNDDIHIWVRDRHGDLHHRVYHDVPYYTFIPDKNGQYKSIYGKRLKKVKFRDKRKFQQYVDENETYESGNRLRKFISDHFYNKVKNANTYPNVAFFDIEVDYDLTNGLGYPMPDNPHGYINAVTIHNQWEDMTYCLYVYSTDVGYTYNGVYDDKVKVIYCQSERELLDKFLTLIEDADILTHWNGDHYDIPYIIARMKKLFHKKALESLCRDGFTPIERTKKDKYGNDAKSFELVGRTSLDYRRLYEKFYLSELPSTALNSVAELELGRGKHEYDGDLGDLYRNDIHKFLTYNIEDTLLVRDLDKKRKYIAMTTKMVKRSSIRYNQIFGSIQFIEGGVRNYAHHEREEPVILPDRMNNEKESFPGAYVFDTASGVYGYVCSIDLTSLYPSVIRALNLSPETIVGQFQGEMEDYIEINKRSMKEITLVLESGRWKKQPATLWYDWLRKKNLCISANGTVTRNDFYGILPEVLTVWFAERKKTKTLSKEYYKKGDKVNGDYYDQEQNTLKVFLNSTFGCVSNPYSIFYDIRLAKSITLTGQIINKYQCYQAEQYLRGLKDENNR